MERQYNPKGFGHYPGIKATPGQVSQAKLVKMLVKGTTAKQLTKAFPWLNALQLGTVIYQLNRIRKKKGLSSIKLVDTKPKEIYVKVIGTDEATHET